MLGGPRRDADAVAATFLARYLEDRARGKPASLAAYQQRFPGWEEVVAREFKRIGAIPAGHRIPPAISQIGHFVIQEELGRGGQGVIYLAEDRRLQRQVALKVLRPELSIGPQRLERFHREALITSRLEHPGLCPVYESGIEQGVPFIAMRYVSGTSLAALIQEARRTSTKGSCIVLHTPEAGRMLGDDQATRASQARAILSLVHLVERVARSIHAAHKAGIIHRDLKPSNIMVTPEGNPVVLDFGLARHLGGDDLSLTFSGDVLGTPRYMAPEQVRGDTRAVDARTDVYALGATLYEALTLKPPLDAATREALFNAILAREPMSASSLNNHVSRDLNVILMTALDKDPNRRYATALDMAEDLRRFREHKPLLARPAGHWLRFRRWVRRHPGTAASLLGLFLVLLAGLGTSFFLLQRSNASARQARANLEAWRRMSDIRLLQDLKQAAAHDLWPTRPRNLLAVRNWMDQAKQLLARLPAHEQELKKLRARARKVIIRDRERVLKDLVRQERSFLSQISRYQRERPGSYALNKARQDLARIRRRIRQARAAPPARHFVFEDGGDQWLHDLLMQLIHGLHGLARPQSGLLVQMQRREQRIHAMLKRSIEDAREGWRQAALRVSKNPIYEGLHLMPQICLIPLGPDPDSGLEEFAELETGSPAKRDAVSGKIKMDGSKGMVFVLLPKDTFHMGAQARDRKALNFDPEARGREGPVNLVSLDPFFISKFEMTQGQWLRVTGENPSHYRPGSRPGGRLVTLANPVEQVSWRACAEVLRRLDMVLPSEAQWEYACRAGTHTVYSTGNTVKSLMGSANIADEASKPYYPASWAFEKGFRDDYGAHAPVGSFQANAFGIHDMHGNVEEWCRDGFSLYTLPVRDGTGLRTLDGNRGHMARGGSHNRVVFFARCTWRHRLPTDSSWLEVGLRPARMLTSTRF